MSDSFILCKHYVAAFLGLILFSYIYIVLYYRKKAKSKEPKKIEIEFIGPGTVCSVCATTLRKENKFCPGCGAEIKWK